MLIEICHEGVMLVKTAAALFELVHLPYRGSYRLEENNMAEGSFYLLIAVNLRTYRKDGWLTTQLFSDILKLESPESRALDMLRFV